MTSGREIAGEGLWQGEKWEGAPLPQQKQKAKKFPALSGLSCDYATLVRGSRMYRALEFCDVSGGVSRESMEKTSAVPEGKPQDMEDLKIEAK